MAKAWFAFPLLIICFYSPSFGKDVEDEIFSGGHYLLPPSNKVQGDRNEYTFGKPIPLPWISLPDPGTTTPPVQIGRCTTAPALTSCLCVSTGTPAITVTCATGQFCETTANSAACLNLAICTQGGPPEPAACRCGGATATLVCSAGLQCNLAGTMCTPPVCPEGTPLTGVPCRCGTNTCSTLGQYCTILTSDCSAATALMDCPATPNVFQRPCRCGTGTAVCRPMQTCNTGDQYCTPPPCTSGPGGGGPGTCLCGGTICTGNMRCDMTTTVPTCTVPPIG